MVESTVPRGKFAEQELENLTAQLAHRLFGVAPGSERWDELRFDQR